MEEKGKILNIHGMWCGPWVWEKLNGFSEDRDYPCVSPALRHHQAGCLNPNPELGITSIKDYVADMERVILEIKKESDLPLIIRGHSMGGGIAQILAAKGYGDALILYAPSAPRGINPLEPSVLECFLPMMISWGFWRKPIKPSFEGAVKAMLHRFPEKEQREVYGKLCYESGRAVFEIGLWAFEWFRRATKVDASKITCPIFIAIGDEDRITPIGVARKIAKKYRNNDLTFREYQGFAHWLPGEPGWEKIAEDSYQWLESI